MAGTLNAHTAGGAQDAGDEASWVVSGTGTSNDGKRVKGAVIVGPSSGLPATVDLGTNGGNAPVAPSGGEGMLGWLASLVKQLLEGTAQINQRRLDPQDDVVACVPGQVASGATLTNVGASVTSVVLLNALATTIGVTAGRMGAIIVNDSPTATLKIAFAATASATSFTDQILPGQTWEMPPPIYGGIISGIWDVASGSARITELS